MHDTTRTMVPTGRRPRGRLGINLRVVYYLYFIPSLSGGPLNKSALYLPTYLPVNVNVCLLELNACECWK